MKFSGKQGWVFAMARKVFLPAQWKNWQ